MIKSIKIIIFSFILEGVLSNLIGYNSYLNPLFSIISIIIMYPFLYDKKNNFYKLSFVTGLMYDIVYTNTIFFNSFLYLLLAFLIYQINKVLSNNMFNITIISFLIIIISRIITYTLLVLIGYINNNFNVLINSINSSLILNIIYSLFLFKIVNLNYKKIFFNKK